MVDTGSVGLDRKASGMADAGYVCSCRIDSLRIGFLERSVRTLGHILPAVEVVTYSFSTCCGALPPSVLKDNLPPGFPPGYILSGNTSHSRAYELLVKKAAGLVRQEEAQRASPPRLSAATTTAKCRTRKLREATSLLRKEEALSTPRRTRRVTKTSAFPRRTPQAKTGKAEYGTNLPASIDVPPQYEATQQTAAAIFSPQTSSATAVEGAPPQMQPRRYGAGPNLSSLPRQESYGNSSHGFPSPSSCSHITPASSSPAVSTTESSPTATARVEAGSFVLGTTRNQMGSLISGAQVLCGATRGHFEACGQGPSGRICFDQKPPKSRCAPE
ncbi:hypothetical protein HPB52_004578 [Rhipicephalus sanguineus]|uniref:Uncharacterized protein n=1 Tax=Rhipicephalus sanguineus TaxID=34632 RepID=A0A9D4QB22_RHISA|nr:hypothetical protein HPB52_004578 [Rhipicephalus sanguineus]